MIIGESGQKVSGGYEGPKLVRPVLISSIHFSYHVYLHPYQANETEDTTDTARLKAQLKVVRLFYDRTFDRPLPISKLSNCASAMMEDGFFKNMRADKWR